MIGMIEYRHRCVIKRVIPFDTESNEQLVEVCVNGKNIVCFNQCLQDFRKIKECLATFRLLTFDINKSYKKIRKIVKLKIPQSVARHIVYGQIIDIGKRNRNPKAIIDCGIKIEIELNNKRVKIGDYVCAEGRLDIFT